MVRLLRRAAATAPCWPLCGGALCCCCCRWVPRGRRQRQGHTVERTAAKWLSLSFKYEYFDYSNNMSLAWGQFTVAKSTRNEAISQCHCCGSSVDMPTQWLGGGGGCRRPVPRPAPCPRPANTSPFDWLDIIAPFLVPYK